MAQGIDMPIDAASLLRTPPQYPVGTPRGKLLLEGDRLCCWRRWRSHVTIEAS
jgi:hypothetical protein